MIGSGRGLLILFYVPLLIEITSPVKETRHLLLDQLEVFVLLFQFFEIIICDFNLS